MPTTTATARPRNARTMPPVQVAAHRAGLIVAEIPSETEPGEHHTVWCLDGQARCSCKGFKFRRACAHTAAVLMMARELDAGRAA